MGQAKQRGTYEERVAMAKERNKSLEEQIKNKPKMQDFVKKHSIQRMHTKLVMAGFLTVSSFHK